ncbi:tetraprenyl-beta-curcumene synthase family protein [Paenibacillus thermotolerans]|uniref:tetraprenyl-beta-curcumene synthase family protein n=1 Tax=Paenibacillus thermotolerans TaxID=3027807 RepID=UPI00236761BB|nr:MULTISPECIES: tetraprenyl-beta-curcumene synthase family protein [unclassified Paenibacillus]
MLRMYRHVLPEVSVQLDLWRKRAETIPHPELREQAIASMTDKRFHCQGGAVYAAANMTYKHVLVPLIVAFQTISDYLDNLCDRSTSLSMDDFRRLHLSMLHAVDPSAALADYYEFREERDDGGYLQSLVKTCQSCICLLPSYATVQPYVKELVGLYADLQVYKHIRQSEREAELLQWWESHSDKYPHIGWNEFAAATGSTLGVFMLFLGASEKELSGEEAGRIRSSYFPYICGLHILLDYLIDREEDRIGGDLNFCEYYDSDAHAAERIGWIAEQARKEARQLKDGRFHLMIVEGLLALYLSDPKVKRQQSVAAITRSLMRNSPLMRLFFWANSVWIRRKDGVRSPQIQKSGKMKGNS